MVWRAVNPDAIETLGKMVSSDIELARLVVGLPWFTDGVDDGEPGTLVQLHVTASTDPDLARLAARLPWFVDGLTGDERDALGGLREVVLADLKIGRQLAGFPWFIDSVMGDEIVVLLSVRDIASADTELARRVVNLPWLADGLIGDERDALDALREVVIADLEIGRRIAGFSWLTDGVTGVESIALHALRDIASADIELARRVVNISWLPHGLAGSERYVLGPLRDVASADLELASLLVDLPWFVDGVTDDEENALHALGVISPSDVEFGKRIADLPWFADGVTYDEGRALAALRAGASVDLDLAERIAALPWFADGAAGGEPDALEALGKMAFADVDLARLVVSLPWFADGLTDGEQEQLQTLRRFAPTEPDWAKLMAALPWFPDGLTAAEGRALSTLRELAWADIEAARRVVSFPWIADGVTVHELQTLAATPKFVLRTWDFTDSDGDGMTDAAETKYGFDPNDASSFPDEPEVFHAERHPIEGSEIGAYYEVGLGTIDLKWTNPQDGTFSLSLRTADSTEWDIYYGGHYSDRAPVELSLFNLSGTETLVGRFGKHALDLSFVEEYSEFIIDLASVEFPDRSAIGNPFNRLGYTFSSDFPEEAEVQYREFLKRVFPIMYEHLGPPAETFNVFIQDVGAYAFEIVDDGRTLLTDADFVPRLIVHEFVHAWKGNFSITSDENWDYDDALSGFEEGIAEGMAFEIVHEYARSYPTHSASVQLLDDRPSQYWSIETTSYDAIKNVRWTGAGDFWTHTDGPESRYSIAATTVQMMVRENPNFTKEFMAQYYEAIREDPDWRPNRDDVIDMWAAIVPALNGYPLRESLDALPVFNGRKLDEGMYVLEAIRVYGEDGDQLFAVTHALPDGRLWWGLDEEELEHVPAWIRTSRGDDGRFYIDTQDSSFTVQVFDAYGEEYAVYNFEADWDREPDGSPTGFGWYYADDLAMEKFDSLVTRGFRVGTGE